MIRIAGIKLSLDQEPVDLGPAISKKLRIVPADLIDYRIVRQSLDARQPANIHFVYTVDVQVRNEAGILKQTRDRNVTRTPAKMYPRITAGTNRLRDRPVVVGTGPAGLFAGLTLARGGYRPLLLERGGDVDSRVAAVARFWETGLLDTDSNVQFGEGGAGTFSDGKLTTLIRDPRCGQVLDELVQAGAPAEIIYTHRPHIGTDILREVVKNIRQTIIDLGGEVRFNSQVTGLKLKGDGIQGVMVNHGLEINAGVVVLAVGHSARDTMAMFHGHGIAITTKSFSVGVRVEHPQTLINQAQYKGFAGHPRLGAADYKLAYHSPSGRSAYTFCMCPGGVVVAAASETGGVVTNGMSYHARSGTNANSALLVGVTPADFGSEHPLAGIEYQRRWEKLAFQAGGGAYRAPAQLVGDFISGQPSSGLGEVIPTYSRGVTPADLSDCLPEYVTATLREALLNFETKLKGFALGDAVLIGVETRSSAPLRIVRNPGGEAPVKGLYPAGEGAGYAGGIISSAVDGIRVAESIIAGFAPLQEMLS
jgi:uncharacterized FAD-dependent dehydrogenase